MNTFKLKVMIVGLIGLLLGTAIPGYAQQRENLYNLYKQNQLQILEESVKKKPPAADGDYELLFFQTLFVKDGEQAEQKYLSVFEYGSPRLKLLAAKKLMAYFYAAGYYVTSEKYQKYLVEHEIPEATEPQPPVARETAPPKYYIQVGAFGLAENAKQRVSFLKTQDVKSQLVERNVNGKTLYCVWIEGKTDLDKSLEYANKIKQKYDLEFQIMKK